MWVRDNAHFLFSFGYQKYVGDRERGNFLIFFFMIILLEYNENMPILYY